MSIFRALRLAGLAATLLVTAVAGQRRGFRYEIEPNASYDGQYTFVRLRYQAYGRSGWEFDYPAMERNFMSIVRDLTSIDPKVAESNVLDMNDPALSHYSIAYLSEPGYWLPSDSEAIGLRTWLQKGGFLIVDDFLLNQWANFERSMMKVLPFAQIIPLTIDHPVFNTFFAIESLEGMSHPNDFQARAQYLGIFENNDPQARLMVIINYNNDIGDYMEWTGAGWYPVNLTNDAYKFATNYLVYALSR